MLLNEKVSQVMISRRKISSTKSVEKMALWRRKTRAWRQIILGLTLSVIFNTQPSSRLYAWYTVYVHVYSTVAEGSTCSRDTKPRIFTISDKVSKYLIKRIYPVGEGEGEIQKHKDSTDSYKILDKDTRQKPMHEEEPWDFSFLLTLVFWGMATG